LKRNLHESRQGKLRLFAVRREVALHNLGEVDELEVVEGTGWQVVVKGAHHVPWPVADADKHDG
jgi:hypothetical protein